MKRSFCLLVALCGTAHAEFYTGNDLWHRINGETLAERNAAIGYIMGVTDATLHALHCAPSDATSGQIRDMVRNYLVSVPQERHHTADSIVVRVLKATWPCPERRRGTPL